MQKNRPISAGLLETADALILALNKLKPGEKIVYYRGLNIHGVNRDNGAARVIDEASILSEEGKVHLARRRISPPITRSGIDHINGIGEFEFLAIGKSRRTR